MSAVAAKAASFIGKGTEHSGMCERFTRTCFGFPARFASAKLAYQASKAAGAIHTDTNPPAGVPVFWDILTGVNAPYDHVAVSVGGGYCVSTSAGPGRTVAKVKIADLTRAWGMRYLGWAEWYHGQRVYTPPAKGSASGTGYPTTNVGTGAADLKSAWYRLLGALGYTGSTAVRQQRWLAKSGHYTGRIDGNFGPMSIGALQRRIKGAHQKNPKVLDPGPADGVRGTRTKKAEASYLNHQKNQARKG